MMLQAVPLYPKSQRHTPLEQDPWPEQAKGHVGFADSFSLSAMTTRSQPLPEAPLTHLHLPGATAPQCPWPEQLNGQLCMIREQLGPPKSPSQMHTPPGLQSPWPEHPY